MADWTQLPKDLLDLIAKRLDSSFEILRFRSVCSTWRSSVDSRKLRPCFPVIPNDGSLAASIGFHIYKRTVFLLESAHSGIQTGPLRWLIKIEEDGHVSNRVRLLDPLSRCRSDSLPEDFPTVLDLRDFRVFELGQEYVLHYYIHHHRPSRVDSRNLYMEKVVFLCLDNLGDFVLLTVHVSGKLAIFRSDHKKWTIIEDMPSPYDDVILYKGNLYAVDNTGRAVLVSLDLSISVIAESVFGGDKKYLVESRGELLLVDMYLSIEAEDMSGLGFFEEYYENLACYMQERTVKFKVFRLDEETHKWVEMKSLGDRLLFLGDDSTFSLTVEEISVCKGNCIIFADNFFTVTEEGDEQKWGGDIGVFDLENGSIGPLGKYPQYSTLFWPPSGWIPSTSAVQGHIEEPTL